MDEGVETDQQDPWSDASGSSMGGGRPAWRQDSARGGTRGDGRPPQRLPGCGHHGPRRRPRLSTYYVILLYNML